MKLIRILLLFITISIPSCSVLGKYDLALGRHVKEFEKICNCTVDVPIKIEEISNTKGNEGTLGVCYAFRGPKFLRYISIDKKYWDSASYYERESTVFHELGHCLLDLEHDENFTGQYVFIRPRSLMFPYAFFQYPMYREEYLKELILKAKMLGTL